METQKIHRDDFKEMRDHFIALAWSARRNRNRSESREGKRFFQGVMMANLNAAESFDTFFPIILDSSALIRACDATRRAA